MSAQYHPMPETLLRMFSADLVPVTEYLLRALHNHTYGELLLEDGSKMFWSDKDESFVVHVYDQQVAPKI